MSREFSHPGDDAVFVRRCRIITAGLIRVSAMVMAGFSTVPLFLFLTGGSWMARSGASSGAVLLVVLTGAIPLAASAGVWFSAGWFARRVFPMPPARSQCPRCKYPVGEIEGDTCPECGARIR